MLSGKREGGGGGGGEEHEWYKMTLVAIVDCVLVNG